MLRAEDIQFGIGKKVILTGINVTFIPGEFNIILGPNGSGKSTFLKIFSGEISNHSGHIFYDKRDIQKIKKGVLAKQRAVLSQQPELSFPLNVNEVVLMGRYPHFAFSPHKNDVEICAEVMHLMGLEGFKDRNYITLSGGEKQRVQFARVLAQVWEQPTNGFRYLFLDEPLNNLDINYQVEILRVAKSLVGAGTVLIAVLHDVNMAIQYGDKLFFLKNGQLATAGKPADIVTSALIKNIFDVQVTIIENPVTGLPLMIY